MSTTPTTAAQAGQFANDHPLAALLLMRDVAHDLLGDDDLSDAAQSHLWNATEELDRIVLDAGVEELATAADAVDSHSGATTLSNDHDREGVKPRGDEAVESADEHPPDCVRWVGHDNDGVPEHGILEIEVTRPLVEWIALEVEEGTFESVGQWARAQLEAQLDELLRRRGEGVETVFSVPDDVAKRARLLTEHHRARGGDTEYEDVLLNHITMDVKGGSPAAESLPSTLEGVDEEA